MAEHRSGRTRRDDHRRVPGDKPREEDAREQKEPEGGPDCGCGDPDAKPQPRAVPEPIERWEGEGGMAPGDDAVAGAQGKRPRPPKTPRPL